MAHYNLGLVHEARRDWPAATPEYEAEITVSPKLYQPHFNLARLLSRAAAVRRRGRALPRGGGQEPGVRHRLPVPGESAARYRRSAGAEQAALKGLASKPDPGMAPLGHFVLADVYAGMGRDADAQRQVALGRRAQQESEK